jgi:hypothetical protein
MKQKASAIQSSLRWMRHSTLPEWLQNGEEKAVSSFTAGFFRDAIFELADFLFPIAGTVDLSRARAAGKKCRYHESWKEQYWRRGEM